jgi:hypothetical protein
MQVVTISSFYESQINRLRDEVKETPDDRVLGLDVEAWLDYLEERFALRPIEADRNRANEMVETEVERKLSRYDIYSDAGAGDLVRIAQVIVKVPVVPSETLRAIQKYGLRPNSFFALKYPRFAYDDQEGTLSAVVAIEEAAVKAAITEVENEIASYNASIADENRRFRARARPIVDAKMAQVREKHTKLDTLSAAVGIRLTKKSDPAKIVPTTPKVRQQIAPVLFPAGKRPEHPVLDAAVFNAILELVDNQCRGFERTPKAFSSLTEEGLRDIILGSLNAVFEGTAGGETFQGVGKVDIHLRIAQGEVFLAEVKFWDGSASLRETVGQLMTRLTWRDSFGVAILLSRNVGFGEVLKSAADELPRLKGCAPTTVRTVDQHHLTARVSIPSDPSRYAEVHVLLFNLFAESDGKRQVRRVK